MTPTDPSSLTQLGRQTRLPESPAAARLETVPNPHPGQRYLVRFTCPEFTSLCLVTGQPDFAHLVIDYVAKERAARSGRTAIPRARVAEQRHRPASVGE